MNQFTATTDVGLERLAAQRLQRLRDSMREHNTPVLLVLDSVNIQYATGASNMTIFSTRTPARYLLLFAEGPSILYEYFGCEHLAQNLATIDEVRPARGLDVVRREVEGACRCATQLCRQQRASSNCRHAHATSPSRDLLFRAEEKSKADR